MKAILVLLVSGCLASLGRAATNDLADIVTSRAKFQRPDVAQVALKETLREATLIIEATIVNSDVTLRASPGQHTVSPGQGWRGVIVSPTTVFKGRPDGQSVLVENGARRTEGVQWHLPIEATNAQHCLLVLANDGQLSKWCQTNVYTVIKRMEVK
jgi:hypothetical protein